MLAEHTKKEFIEFLIGCNVLKFGEFITKSGRQTPYFINTGNFKTGRQLKILGEFYAKQINDFKNEIDVLFGPAYKGISLVVCCCAALLNSFEVDMPFLFNRKEAKDHGEKGSFIGYMPKPNEKIAIVEDVLTAGTAINEVVPKIKQGFGSEINHLFIAVDRCEKKVNSEELARNTLKQKFQIEVHSIVNIFDIKNFIENNVNFKDQLHRLDAYLKTYCINQKS